MKVSPFVGLLLAPLPPAAVAALFVGFHPAEFDYDTYAGLAFSIITGGYIAGFCIGWPLLHLWKRLSWTGPLAGGGLGAFSASGLTLIMALTFAPSHGDVTLVRAFGNLLTFTVPIGAVAGFTFWWLSMRSLNDRVSD